MTKKYIRPYVFGNDVVLRQASDGLCGANRGCSKQYNVIIHHCIDVKLRWLQAVPLARLMSDIWKYWIMINVFLIAQQHQLTPVLRLENLRPVTKSMLALVYKCLQWEVILTTPSFTSGTVPNTLGCYFSFITIIRLLLHHAITSE